MLKVKGFTPHPDQRRKIDLIEKGQEKYIVLTTGRQWGKTMMGVNLLLKWALGHKEQKLMWVSPIYKQSKNAFDILTNAIKGTPILKKDPNISELEITLINGSKIMFRSAERADGLRGHTLDYLICDEAAFMKTEVWDTVLKPTILVKGKKVLFISTPRGKNFLYSLSQRGMDPEQTSYLTLRGTSYDTPFISSDELDEAQRTLPEDVFKQEIMGEFIDSGGEVFKDIDRFCTLTDWVPKDPTMKYYAGLDLGRTEDYTVLTILDQEGKVVHIYRDRHKSWDEIVRNVIRDVKRYNAQLQIEVNSIGDVIFENVRREWKNTHPFVTSSNSKMNIIEDLIYASNESSIQVPTYDLFPHLYNELKVFSFEYNPKSRNVKYGALQGHHDDCVMSLAIAYNTLKQKRTSGTYYMY
jgi:hypothetical protein